MKRLRSSSRETRSKKLTTPPVCPTCRQNLEDLIYYNGHPNNSSEELIALTDEKLLIFTGDEEDIHERDSTPVHKLTSYSVYDSKGHLVCFDTGLVEENVVLRLSGYIKAIYTEDSSIEDGVAAYDLGPINTWYISGFDGGEQSFVGIVTAYAQYILMQPSEEYAPVVKTLNRKIPLLKTVVEFLLDYGMDNPSYPDLLYHLQTRNEDFTEEFLLENVQFICKQVYSFEQAAPDEDSLTKLPCMKTLMELSGVTLKTNKYISSVSKNARRKHVERKSTTTPLVRSVFEHFFPLQITGDVRSGKKKRCGICEGCQAPDCGACVSCGNMPKFGGKGTSKQACKLRRCDNLEDDDESESSDADEHTKITFSYKPVPKKIIFPATPIVVHNEKKFYSAACVGSVSVKPLDYVILNPDGPDQNPVVGKIISIFTKHHEPTFHAQMFCRGVDTILGQTADLQELFFADVCEDCPLASILDTVTVRFKQAASDWTQLGGVQTLSKSDSAEFFFSKKFDTETGRFTQYSGNETETGICTVCLERSHRRRFDSKTFDGNSVQWKGDLYENGSCVFLDPSAYKFQSSRVQNQKPQGRVVDEEIYPEYYRKSLDAKTATDEISEPFCIAQIVEIYHVKKADELKIKARLFYRPENTEKGDFLAYSKDINLVFWSEEVITTRFCNVAGICNLRYFCDANEAAVWSEKGPNRFYFTEAYNRKTLTFYDVPQHAFQVGGFNKRKDKGKLQSESCCPEWEKIDRPLRCLDVFAGCGGLSLGLHQAGISETKWAIENMSKPAEAFKLNNPTTKVFVDDCNKVLKEILSGSNTIKNLPQKGDVEILVGGPPCQGFSHMNRFSARQHSLIKNSLIATLLSFCDYYRPRYFVLENVRNFASFKRSMVLKLTLRCLLAMDYQIAFGVLQAAHHGIPQTRRRFILVAAAPGCLLPQLPQPQNVFTKVDYQLGVTVDGVKYRKDVGTKSAPYRLICVRDAISDLPPIENGHRSHKMEYDSSAISHFQRMLRGDAPLLYDHVCKDMAPIVEARISHIPGLPGADWRDLPNVCVRLRDDTLTNKLHYQCYSRKQKKFDQPRAICGCGSGRNCNPQDRQNNTLIPWCLPHTADRHNNWAGLYGRLGWDEVFKTTITNPEPLGKQGKVIHPEQHRVVSVRECARSQGFPDQFKFAGSIMDKHRQIGNAVPPPLGKAIGEEIRKALALDRKL